MKSPDTHLKKLENFLDSLPDDCGQGKHVEFTQKWIKHARSQIAHAVDELEAHKDITNAILFLRSIDG